MWAKAHLMFSFLVLEVTYVTLTQFHCQSQAMANLTTGKPGNTKEQSQTSEHLQTP